MSKFYRVRDDAVGPDHSMGDYEETYSSLPNFMQKFKERASINILSSDEEKMEFEVIGIDASVANALRRIMIAEVPTMAMERVLIENNTSIIQDDVLAHRLGLIPINVDPELFESTEGDLLTENNSIEFKLEVTCQKGSYESVYSGDLQWVPLGNQLERFKGKPPAPVHSDILIAKMRPGQEIFIRAICCKGIGREHAKWSPVCTASYRLLPVIKFETEIVNEEADKVVASCPMGVFDIEDLGNQQRKAVVKDARKCTMCRECIRDTSMQPKISLLRKGDHFIFSVEAVGMLSPQRIFKKSISILQAKCTNLAQEMKNNAVST